MTRLTSITLTVLTALTVGCGGYGILADSAFLNAAGLLVQVRTISAGRGCITAASFTQPVDIARIPRMSGEVTFRDRPEVTDCR